MSEQDWKGYSEEAKLIMDTLSMEQQLEVYEAFRILKLVMNPKLPKSTREIVEFILGYRASDKSFIGGIGNAKRTLHENLYAWLFPLYRSQVTFGTGKDGFKNFGCNQITVDFLDDDGEWAYEIDGPNHKTPLQAEKDRFKENFLQTKHGIRTIRYTNQYVEDMIFFHLAKWAKDFGSLREVEMVDEHVRKFIQHR